MKQPDQMFTPKFSVSEIGDYARAYSYQTDEHIREYVPRVRERGYLTKEELKELAEWKTPRSKPRVARNSEDFLQEITGIALNTKSERLRIEVLTLLEGVGWPTASVILHFYHPEPYPVIDFRALYSLNCEHIKPQHYNFNFWQRYVAAVRNLMQDTGLDARTIDKALWQYSKQQVTPA